MSDQSLAPAELTMGAYRPMWSAIYSAVQELRAEGYTIEIEEAGNPLYRRFALSGPYRALRTLEERVRLHNART